MNYDFRRANINNLDELKIMFEDITKNMNENGINIWDEVYPFMEFENDIEKSNMYLLTNNNNIVASIVLYKSNEHSDCFEWKNKETEALYIARFGVNVKYLKKGIGSIDIEEAKKIAQKENIDYLRLLVVDTNVIAIKFYEKIGFNKVSGIFVECADDLEFIEYGYEMKI